MKTEDLLNEINEQAKEFNLREKVKTLMMGLEGYISIAPGTIDLAGVASVYGDIIHLLVCIDQYGIEALQSTDYRT